MAGMSIPYGKELASRLASEIIFYHGHGRGLLEHRQQTHLDRMAETKRQNNSEIKVTSKVDTVGTEEKICNLVDKNKIYLTIMTAVTTAGLKTGKMRGSVADHVCQTVPTPILLLQPEYFHRSKGKKSCTAMFYNSIFK